MLASVSVLTESKLWGCMVQQQVSDLLAVLLCCLCALAALAAAHLRSGIVS
jgi:hypothetical protein